MISLEIREIAKSFGGLKAVNNVSIKAEKGEILGLIGPNGAGKTTIFNIITGFYRSDRGQILFKGEDISHLQPYQICLRGIARTFQLVKPFAGLTVLDNVMIGAFARTDNRARARQQALEVLNLVGLADREGKIATELTISDRKRMELARAMATEPELLMLDEVMTGLNPVESAEIQRLILKLRGKGITILIIEHVMRAVMNLSDRIIVLYHGEVIVQGGPKEISQNERVIEAYLGKASYA